MAHWAFDLAVPESCRMTSHKQTVSYLRRKFQEIGLQPYAKHGQNFLIDLNLLELLVRVADLRPTDVVLEVGTGTGSLTVRLAERAGAVVTVEIDPHLAQMAQEQFDRNAPIVLLQQDALRNKNHFHTNVLEAVREQLAKIPNAQFKLVANLPYSIATPVISNLLSSDLPPSSMTITIQKELADRLVASPRTKEYGSLSVWVQSQCNPTIIRELAPSVFWPRPKVTSAIVQILLDVERRRAIDDRVWFHEFVRGVFLHRRKFLRSALLGAFKTLDKPTVDAVMRELNFGGQTRAEELTVNQIQQLAATIQRHLTDRPPTV
jgi:16S rRNA (adenine1518-N6/adenine1519-N6)-dimethyltransferase